MVKTPKWVKEQLKFNPLEYLGQKQYEPIRYFMERDVLGEAVSDTTALWNDPLAQKILAEKKPDGSWPDPDRIKHLTSTANHVLISSYRKLAVLTGFFEYNRSHPQIDPAAQFILSHQTELGDIRGPYGNQYCPDYMGAMLEILNKLGYGDSPQVKHAMKWLADNQLNDGGWAVPMYIKGGENADYEALMRQGTITMPLSDTKSSHNVTAMVFRALISHPLYKSSEVTKKAANFLVESLLKPDSYANRQSADYWTQFSFPYYWCDLISVLDSLSTLKLDPSPEQIQKALNYFRESQMEDGSWGFMIVTDEPLPSLKDWLTLKVATIFKRFYG